MSIGVNCDMCNDELEEGEAYGLTTVEIEGSWIDCPVTEISTFIHPDCYSLVVKLYSQDIVDGFIDLDDPFGLEENSNAELV